MLSKENSHIATASFPAFHLLNARMEPWNETIAVYLLVSEPDPHTQRRLVPRLYTFMYMIVDTCNEESTDIQGKCTRLNYLKR